MSSSKHKKLIITSICLAVGALHLFTGPDYRGPFRIFVTGYFIDIALPFALVLLFGLATDQIPLKINPVFRGAFVFGIGVFVEMCQYFGIHLFGKTFDPLDLLAYAGGAFLGLLFEKQFFSNGPHHKCTLPVIKADPTVSDR